MRRRYLLLFLFGGMVINAVFAQQLERITYEEMRSDNSFGRTVTVDAYFLGWSQQEVFWEDGIQAVYECFCPIDGEWSDWELMGKMPAIAPTLRLAFDWIQRDYNAHPKGAKIMYLNGTQSIRLLSIPDRQTSPIWWSKTGKSFYMFYKIYLLNP